MSATSGGALAALAAEVGPPEAGPVVALGSGSHAVLGGPVDPAARPIRAPAGILSFAPAEMVVRVLAGTTVDELDEALAPAGQLVALPSGGRTVGGVLAVGHSGLRRLGWGPVRDVVLQASYVTAAGEVAVAGGPTVKNVTGYDLCRLLVGSLGTLGILGELVLRTRPVPAAAIWLAGPGDPWELRARLHRPTAILWDGASVWVHLSGHPADVHAQARLTGLVEAPGPPPLPPHRWSLPPAALAELPARCPGRFVAEIGVGVVHREDPQPRRALAPAVAELHRRLKSLMDPTGRLAPWRSVGAP